MFETICPHFNCTLLFSLLFQLCCSYVFSLFGFWYRVKRCKVEDSVTAGESSESTLKVSVEEKIGSFSSCLCCSLIYFRHLIPFLHSERPPRNALRNRTSDPFVGMQKKPIMWSFIELIFLSSFVCPIWSQYLVGCFYLFFDFCYDTLKNSIHYIVSGGAIIWESHNFNSD